jgi:hypothetical protein
LWIRIQTKISMRIQIQIIEKCSESFRDFVKQPGLHHVLSVTHIFNKFCRTLHSISIFVMIWLKKNFGFWLSELICTQLDQDPDQGGRSFSDPCGSETLLERSLSGIARQSC